MQDLPDGAGDHVSTSDSLKEEKTNGSISLSPSEAAYRQARGQAKSIQNPLVKADQWKTYPDTDFSGDIKIVERKADTAPHVESDIPSYLHNRKISIIVLDAFGDEFDPEKLESDGLRKISENEIETTGLLIENIVEQAGFLLSRIFNNRRNFIELRITFDCPLSNLHSLVVKQILCQEFNEVDHVLVETAPGCCSIKFYENSLGKDQKKFTKGLRSALEFHELASRIHAVGLEYNSGPFPEFEKHVTVPEGLLHCDDR
ncbi:hypothetical protein FO519_002413 [Halicephalobus sp. NKZ332]|nr:hypothetical protein FO519_002413 [Halicephalobus sp. NKZ332]